MKFRLYCFALLTVSLLKAQEKTRDLGSENWKFRQKTAQKYYPAKVPGTVHTDLYANKLISNPFFGANEKQLQWIENEDWIYETTFTVSKPEKDSQNCILDCYGLDTYAEIFLNGKKVLDADNMFRTWEADVKGQLKTGNNHLQIVFHSAVKKGKEAAKNLPYTLPGDEKVFTRKAQYHYGWDWGPRFATAGIWKKISLQFWNGATLQHIKYEQKRLDDKVAELQFKTTIEASQSGKYQLEINGEKSNIELQKGSNTITTNYKINNPKKWWPNGLGEAFLYPFTLELSKNGKILSQSKLNIGLRTIELIQEKDAIGKSFYFKVNGVPVFMKGANYIPPDSFLPSVTDSVYKSIVKNAADTNMNMLRIWGGGVYPDDAFYDACDKNGLLVWQDFMFACAMYPGDAAFLENVKQEVIDNVSRLQNHASLALWCGNNESDEGWKNWGWQKQYNYSADQENAIWNDYQKLFHKLIPQTLNELLPENENRYWPSSPSIGWGRKESLLEGDAHYWGVWWGMEPFDVYKQKVGRFMSEYGFQGMPDLATFSSFAKSEDLNLDSEAVKNHQKHPTGYQTISEYMARDYKVPQSFEDFIYVSQLLQAEGMKTAIEAHRRAKPNCMGSLYWQLNDCWPVTSWSSVDYFGRWKALHYQVKKSFENVLVSVDEADGNVRIHIINDELKAYKGMLRCTVTDFTGKQVYEKTQTVNIGENSAKIYLEVPVAQWKERASGLLLSATFESEGRQLQALHYFVKHKELQLKKPKISIRYIDDTTLEITSDVLAKNVMLSSDKIHFSDNYFDILPGQKVRVKLSAPSNNIQVKSLFDTIK